MTNKPIKFDGKYFIKDLDNKEPFKVGDYIKFRNWVAEILKVAEGKYWCFALYIDLKKERLEAIDFFLTSEFIHLKEVPTPAEMPEEFFIENLSKEEIDRYTKGKSIDLATDDTHSFQEEFYTRYIRADLANKTKLRKGNVENQSKICVVFPDHAIIRSKCAGFSLKNFGKDAVGWLPFSELKGGM